LDDVFPLNTPILVPGDASMAAKLGLTGTLPAALDGIFDQTGAVVIVVRVAEGVDDEATISNVIGGVNVTTGAYEGVHAFLGSESTNGFCPRILCAPGFTSARTDFANPVVAEMVGIAERLRAVVIADGPNTTDAQAITYRGDWGSKRVYIVDPAVKVRNALGEIVDQPASARVAGLIAKIDNDLGFWWSPSNKVINGIVGTGRDIDFTLGDANSRANLLNEQEVATIIRQDGYRLWGNRTASDDPKFAFLSVVRTADMINDSILRAHMWAVDRNITRTYLEDVAQGVNDYLDRLKAQGAILGGRCFPSPGLNTPSSIADGKVFFDFEFTPPFPAEHITFRSKLVNDYIEEIL
jgi:phage tail sheath protein FI